MSLLISDFHPFQFQAASRSCQHCCHKLAADPPSVCLRAVRVCGGQQEESLPTSSGENLLTADFKIKKKGVGLGGSLSKRMIRDGPLLTFTVDPSKLNFTHVLFSLAEPELYQEEESNAMR